MDIHEFRNRRLSPRPPPLEEVEPRIDRTIDKTVIGKRTKPESLTALAVAYRKAKNRAA